MIYIHVPFCKRFCIYCDFYSETNGNELLQDAFVRALCREISLRADEVRDNPDTIYLGGGTPSVLSPDSLSAISGTIYDKCGVSGSSEFTMEVNPDDIVSKGVEYVRGIRHAGVDRVSMGVQSFDDGMLKWMRRRHDSATAVKAFGILREGGIENISIDLIFGISHLDDSVWKRSVDMALSLAPEHISAYQLSVGSGSVLAGYVKTGKYVEAEEEQCSRQYYMLCDALAEAGFHHYEISNFALPGKEAVHNSAYWSHAEYSGFGPGAHSLSLSDGIYVRNRNIDNVGLYVKSLLGEDESPLDMVADRCPDVLGDRELAEERIMLSLRTDKGIDRRWLETHCAPRMFDAFVSRGLLVQASEPGCLRIPESSFFISDSIISSLI